MGGREEGAVSLRSAGAGWEEFAVRFHGIGWREIQKTATAGGGEYR